jgi:F0F1-type ATP synthase membrane subunit a
MKDYMRVVPTADLSTTLGLSVSVLLMCLFYNIKIKGLGWLVPRVGDCAFRHQQATRSGRCCWG